MIEETVRVVEVKDAFALVEPLKRTSACGTCSASGACGTSVLSKVLGQRRSYLRVSNPIDAREGETVVIGLRDEALVRGSLAVYIAPLATMLLGALLGEGYAASDGGGEGIVVLAGLAGLAAGFGWVGLFGRRAAGDPRYQPVILRRETFDPPQAAPIHFKR